MMSGLVAEVVRHMHFPRELLPGVPVITTL